MRNKNGKTKMSCLIILLFLCCFGQLFAAECGDVNNDGTVDIVDALLIAQDYVDLNPENFDSSVADVNNDGITDIVDALLVAQYYVILITELNCGDTPETPTPTPEEMGEQTYELQAETEATWSSGIIESDHSGYTGSAYVNVDNASGEWIEWTIDIAADTNAKSVFTYACASEDRSMRLIVNRNELETLGFPASGAWTTWATEEATFSLTGGSNTIRLEATVSGGPPNIDKMDITLGVSIVTATPTPPPTPTSTLGPTFVPGNGDILPQEGNPVRARFDLYKDFVNKADNILSYQLDNGGWEKNQSYDSSGSGGSAMGTFDNGATTMELTVMADAYKRTNESKYLNAARKAMNYVLNAQYPEGGWPQFYPLRGGYSDHVTFNDDAMSRIVTLLHYALIRMPPLDTDVFTDDQLSGCRTALAGGVDYILKAQIMQNGKKTVWCAQHGKSDYQPKQGRAYEHPSLSGSESIEVIGFLMTQPQTTEISNAVKAAVDWYRSPDTYEADYAYENDKFIKREGSRIWYRFYDIPTNLPIFSNYDGVIWIGLEYESKKKSGYRWAGTWGEKIIDYANSVGY